MIRSITALAGAAFVAIAAASLAATPVRAEIDYPWCSLTSASQSGLPVCLYATLEQCQAFIGGMAGFCQRNARFVAKEQAIRRGVR